MPDEPDEEDREIAARFEQMYAHAEAFERMLEKTEPWNCKVGDFLEVIADGTLYDWPDGPGGKRVSEEMRAEGQIYRVADLKGRGFDLELVSGNGPPEIRAMNSEIPRRYKVVPDPERGGRK